MLYRINKFVCTVFLTLSLLLASSSAQSAELRTVFFNMMWGAMIGAVSGVAFWAVKDSNAEFEDFTKITVRGSALGIFFGLGYGLYEVQKPNVSSFHDSAMNYVWKENQWHFSPSQIFVSVIPYTVNSKSVYSSNLLKVSF